MISRMMTGQYDVIRTLVGSSPGGIYTSGTPTTIPAVKMGIQPVDGVDLQDTPEAQYGAETIVIYSFFELRTRGMTSDESDVVVYKTKKYRVTRVQHFDTRSDHYRAYAVKLDVP